LISPLESLKYNLPETVLIASSPVSRSPAAAGDVTVGANGFEYAPLRCADITGSGATSGYGTLSGFDIDGGDY